MRAVYSTVFLALQGVDASESYTVPEGFTAIVRDLDGLIVGGGSSTQLVLLDASSGTYLYLASGDTGITMHQWRGRQVFEAGETFTCEGAGPVSVSFRVSGYLLSST